MSYKKLYLFTLPIFFSVVTGCKNNSSSNHKAEVIEKIDIFNYFNDFAATANTYNPAASFTFQCNNKNPQKIQSLSYGTVKKNGDKVTEKTLFQIGSNSKPFLAVIVLLLEEEGRLNINHTVGTYLTEYPLWQNVTLKQLLNMTSGIPNYLGDSSFIDKIKNNPLHKFTYTELLNLVKNEPIEKKIKFNYSNTNYVLLAKIIETVTKNSLKNEINKRILKPLDLKHTFYIEHLAKEELPIEEYNKLAASYSSDIVGLNISDTSLSWALGAGSMLSTAQDLNTYLQAVFTGKILSAKQRAKFLTPVDMDTGLELPYGVNTTIIKEGYGLGIRIKYDASINQVIYTNSGGTLTFVSNINYIPKFNISFATTLNTSSFVNNNLNDYFNNLPKKIVDHCK